MSKENKYYTPDISEFHVGFEYEQLIPGNIWDKNIYAGEYATRGWMLPCNEDESLATEYVRAKYLDKKDIEECGWGNCKLPYEYDHSWMLKEYKLQAWLNEWPSTIRISHDFTFVNLFHGKIKNISELRKLMKQLNIL